MDPSEADSLNDEAWVNKIGPYEHREEDRLADTQWLAERARYNNTEDVCGFVT